MRRCFENASLAAGKDQTKWTLSDLKYRNLKTARFSKSFTVVKNAVCSYRNHHLAVSFAVSDERKFKSSPSFCSLRTPRLVLVRIESTENR